MLLAIDIGNTNITLGLFIDGEFCDVADAFVLRDGNGVYAQPEEL